LQAYKIIDAVKAKAIPFICFFKTVINLSFSFSMHKQNVTSLFNIATFCSTANKFNVLKLNEFN
jgi:hypothetical protein